MININPVIDLYAQYSKPLLRYGMAFVFLWFGVMQLMNPIIFTAYLPKEVELIPLEPAQFVVLNGMFEVFFGVLLALGIYTRLSAFLLASHLAGITMTLGFTEIGVRDMGLTIAGFTVFLQGADQWCLDTKLAKQQVTNNDTQ